MEKDPLRGIFECERSTPNPSLWTAGKPLAIYGAGGFGLSVHRALLDQSITVSAFIDRGAQPGQMQEGIPILHPDSMDAAQWNALTIVIGIHNPGTSVRLIQDDLKARGCERVLTPIDIVNHLGPSFGTRYWLGPSQHYLASEFEIRAARAIIEPESHALFDAVLAQRISGNYHLLPNPTHGIDDYLPADIAVVDAPLRVIDGGAYDGDTLRGLQKHGFALEAVAAFEPDPENFAKLATWVRLQPALNATLWPCGLYSHTTQLHFSSGQGEASAITSVGGTMIQCVSVDEAIHGFRPNLLKLDVEGAEPEALLGAKNAILTCRPFITAGLYHHPSHLWQVPLLLKSLHPDYRLHLRLHAHNGFDLWLHAVPTKGPA